MDSISVTLEGCWYRAHVSFFNYHLSFFDYCYAFFIMHIEQFITLRLKKYIISLFLFLFNAQTLSQINTSRRNILKVQVCGYWNNKQQFHLIPPLLETVGDSTVWKVAVDSRHGGRRGRRRRRRQLGRNEASGDIKLRYVSGAI